jgi:6,7-dimethyl-8-ribityllumazine synthase
LKYKLKENIVLPILIIEARFYSDLADMLKSSAEAVLRAHKYGYEIISVPGCFELPSAAAMAISSRHYSGIIALGCVIRGETSHYDVVCNETARGLNELAIKNLFPLGFGVITAEDKSQAYVRADVLQKDMGGKAAKACVEMLAHRAKFCS